MAGNGVSRWDHRAFLSLTTVNGLASNTVQAGTYDPITGMVWFGTDQGISRYNPTTNTFTTFLSGQNVKALRVAPGGFIFAGTWGGGLFKLNASTGATVSQFTRANTGGSGNIGGNWLVSDQITSLALEDNGNVLWVGTDRGAPVGGSTDHVGGISRYQINTNSSTSSCRSECGRRRSPI